MKKWRKKGSKHYKFRSIEPLDLISAHGRIPLSIFCLGNIVKYADRNLGTSFHVHRLFDDLDKIIHYAEILKEELLCQSQKCTESRQKTESTSEEETK